MKPEAVVDRSSESHPTGFAARVLWGVVGVAVGAIGYAAEAGGFEMEMRRAAARGGIRER